MASMNGKVCLVTGANGSIGRATAQQLAAQGAHVVLLCRSKERGEEARKAIIAATKNDQVDLVLVDLSSMADVKRAAAELKQKYPRINVLVNNAAVFSKNRELTPEGIEKTFATNYLSHFLLTNLLLDQLKAGAPSRVVSVATKTQGLKMDFDDLNLEKHGYGFLSAVGQTKLALILFTMELAKRLQGTGVTANALHPGLVKTELLKEMSWPIRTLIKALSAPPEKGCRTSVYLATSDEVANTTGKLFADCKEVKIGGQAADPAAPGKLWAISEKLTGLARA